MTKSISLLIIFCFAYQYSRCQQALLYGKFLQHNRYQSNSFVDAELTLMRDTFHYHQYLSTGGKSFLEQYGSYQVQNDTINLFNSKGDTFARLVPDTTVTFMTMVRPQNNYLPEGTSAKNKFYRLAAYDEHGLKRMMLELHRLGNDNGMPADYNLINYDSLQHEISVVPYLNGEKNGMEIHYIYLKKPDSDPTKSSYNILKLKYGKWKNGRKSGRWKYYNDIGNIIKEENYH